MATVAGLATRWHLGENPRGVAEAVAPGGQDRLVAGRDRLLVRAGGFGEVDTGPTPTDRAKKGSKHHVMVDATGIPLSANVSAANVHDVQRLLWTAVTCPLSDYGQEDHLPQRLLGDRAYHSQDHEAILYWMGIEPVFARRGQPHGSGLGKQRYVVERTIAALHQNRRLKIRYENRSELHQAFLTLACIKICYYRL